MNDNGKGQAAERTVASSKGQVAREDKKQMQGIRRGKVRNENGRIKE